MIEFTASNIIGLAHITFGIGYIIWLLRLK